MTEQLTEPCLAVQERHEGRTQAQIDAIKQRWLARQQARGVITPPPVTTAPTPVQTPMAVTTTNSTPKAMVTLTPQHPVLPQGTYDEYKCGDGVVQIHKNVNPKDSDYTKLIQVAEHFTKEGGYVLLTPKMHNVRSKEYDTIYGSLKGTKFYGKCPDICKNGVWYEHEGFTTDNAKKAFGHMLSHGLKQSNRLVIEEPELKR